MKSLVLVPVSTVIVAGVKNMCYTEMVCLSTVEEEEEEEGEKKSKKKAFLRDKERKKQQKKKKGEREKNKGQNTSRERKREREREREGKNIKEKNTPFSSRSRCPDSNWEESCFMGLKV